MATGRKSGRKGRVYLDQSTSANGAATPITGVDKWSINLTADKFDVTAMGDTNKQYASGLPDGSITISGFFDDSDLSFVKILGDGLSRKFYGYDDTSNTNAAPYWFGTVVVGGTHDFAVSAGNAFSAELDPTSAISIYG